MKPVGNPRRRWALLGIFSLWLLLPAAAQGPAPALAGPPDQVVRLKDIEFLPARIRAQGGQSIEFVNDDPFEHDVYIVPTADPNNVFFGPRRLKPGESVRVRVEADTLYSVYCTIHGGMEGKLTTSGSFELTAAQKAKAARSHAVAPIARKGKGLFWGKAQCYRCHSIGSKGQGLRGPNLQNIGFRAGARAKERGLASGTQYLIESILDPPAYVVPGYSNDMIRPYQPPVSLKAGELRSIVAYLQSQGGKVDEWAIEIPEAALSAPPAFNPFGGGDPKRGEHVFFKKAYCGSCHTVGKRKALSVAPELTQIGAFRNWTWFAQSILDPNAEVGANWKNAMVDLKNGESVSGILHRKSSQGLEILVRSDEIRKIPAAEVQSLSVEPTSRMPGNYAELLTFEDMADLIAYLESLSGAGG